MKEIQTAEAKKEAFLALKELCGSSFMRFSGNELLWANAAALKQFKIDGQESAPVNRSMLFVNYEDYLHMMARVSAYGFVRDHRCLMKRTDQTSFWANITTVQRNVQGQSILEDMVSDISKLVMLEQQLHENKLLLAKVGEELDRFVYRASHDLRGPICSAKGLINLIKQESLTPEHELISMMEANIDKLETNINRLTEVSKNNNIKISSEQIILADFINRLVNQFRFHSNFKKISFDVQVQDNYFVVTDKVRLRSILQHVIENCLDFCDANKKRSFVNINIIALKESCTIEILDNGIGIQKHCLPHVFQMFYRGSNLSKGSGLGLYIAREAAIKLGGNIELKSEFKVGTSLRISFPHLIQEH